MQVCHTGGLWDYLPSFMQRTASPIVELLVDDARGALYARTANSEVWAVITHSCAIIYYNTTIYCHVQPWPAISSFHMHNQDACQVRIGTLLYILVPWLQVVLFDLGASGNGGPVRKAEFVDLMAKAVNAPGGRLHRDLSSSPHLLRSRCYQNDMAKDTITASALKRVWRMQAATSLAAAPPTTRRARPLRTWRSSRRGSPAGCTCWSSPPMAAACTSRRMAPQCRDQ